MSGSVMVCEDCGSRDIRLTGTNVRGARDEPHYYCEDCGHRSPNAKRRESRRDTPDKPSNGFARKVWEIGEKETGRSD